MDKIVSFSEWLQVRDPELYENFTPLKRKIMGGVVGAGLGVGAYMGGLFGGGEAPKTPTTPAPHVRSIDQPRVTQSRDHQIPSRRGVIDDESATSDDAGDFVGQGARHPKWTDKDHLNLFRAMRDSGITMRELRASGVPHGQEIDVDGDGQPNNPTTNYFNTGDRTYYGRDGKAKWTFIGGKIRQVR